MSLSVSEKKFILPRFHYDKWQLGVTADKGYVNMRSGVIFDSLGFSGGQRGSNLASLLMTDASSRPSNLGESIAQIIGLESIATGDHPQADGSITPEEVSGISSSDAVTIQSSGGYNEHHYLKLEIFQG